MKKSVIFLFGLFILCNAVIFAGGGMDKNGLKPGAYDKNGWAKVNGQWVSSPNGAVYLETVSSVTAEPEEIVPDEIVSEEIPNVQITELQPEPAQEGLDLNGLRRSDYDINGWALKDGVWVKSPAGALYAGQEKTNLEYLVSSAFNLLSNEERGMLKALLLYGKNAEKNVGHIINSPERLAEYGKDVTARWVIEQLDASFTEGTGFMDSLTGKKQNYGAQLDDIIKNVLVKQMKVPKPKFTAKANTVQGAIQRENWIAETMLDNFISSMSKEDRAEFARIVAEELESEGIILDQGAKAVLATGGLIALKRKLPFAVYKNVTIIANKIAWLILKRGLKPIENRLVMKIINIAWGKAIPVVGVISLIWTISDIPGLINPRDYDKYIPAVFILGLNRLSQAGNT